MNQEIASLSPRAIWKNFAALNAVPRASKKEERIIQFMLDFANQLGLPSHVDAVGNVLITKEASKGMEKAKTVVLQSHLDMVHQKNNETDFNFDTDGIKMKIEGEWVVAEGTTLGADNGMGVATIMAILESQNLLHPKLEALFTIDEETGMTGAKGLANDWLEGKILLNLDTEEDDEIGIGCAGGIDLSATRRYEEVSNGDKYRFQEINVKGLQGGHSGMDIDKGLGNANKIMNRLLYELSTKLSLAIKSIDGGGLRNAIPRESKAIVAVLENEVEAAKKVVEQYYGNIQNELKTTDPRLTIEIKPCQVEMNEVMEDSVKVKLLSAIYAAQNGVYKMSTEMDGLVETSNNIARVEVKDGEIRINCLVRSSTESSKNDLVNSLRSVFELVGCEVILSGDYPGWQPDLQSDILKLSTQVYSTLFGSAPRVEACHAGLECGIIGQHYPTMEMISFGPTIRGAHSPDEKVNIASVEKFWTFIQEILKQIP